MRRKEHDEIVTQNYRTSRKSTSFKGKSIHKRNKARRPSSKILLKSALRRFIGVP